jgi:predicted nucleic acid-binding protein
LAFLLDTDVAIHPRDGDEAVTAKVSALGGAILLSVISRVELEGGVYQYPRKPAYADRGWMQYWRRFPCSLLTIPLPMRIVRSSRRWDIRAERSWIV